MEQVKVKMSENCEQMYNTLLKGCGITKEDINKTDYEYGWSDCAVLAYTRDEDYISIECDMMSLINLMSSINYELLYCDYDALHLLERCYGLPNEQCTQFIGDTKFQMIFDESNSDSDKMVVFELNGEYDTLTYHIERAIFSDKDGNTVLFEENKGFITPQEQTAPTHQQSNSTNNEDLETRVNNIEEKLDTLIKMLSK